MSSLSAGGGAFGYTPPGAHPFGSPYLIVLDSFRILILLLVWANWGSMCLVFFRTARRRKAGLPISVSEQRWTVLALSILAGGLYVAETEISHLGTGVGAGGRLWLGFIMMGGLFWWLWLRRRDDPLGVG